MSTTHLPVVNVEIAAISHVLEDLAERADAIGDDDRRQDARLDELEARLDRLLAIFTLPRTLA